MHRQLVLHLGESPQIGEVARHLGVSARTLQARLREHGTPFQELLREVRLKIAQRYLARTDEPGGAIGARMGFRSPEAFSRSFRKEVGTTPRALRKTLSVRQR